MKRLALAIATVLLISLGTTGCSDATGPECTVARIPLTAVFTSRVDSLGNVYSLEYGDSYVRMLAAGGTCTLLKIEGDLVSGYPVERRHYSCVVCLEAYDDNWRY